MTTTTDNLYQPDIVFPPGETLEELLDELDMTQTELAKRTGLSTKHVNQIIKGLAPITPETALLLERATSVNARTWSNLEIAYREFLTRQDEEQRLSADIDWLDELPIKEMAKRGCISHRERTVETLREVCRFFGVANRGAWEAIWKRPTAYRTSRAFTSDPGAVAAWLRLGEIEAAAIHCDPFDKTGLSELLPEFRNFTCETNPREWWPRLVDLCSSVGVALVAEPEIKGARINGAARWLAPDKAIIQLSLRYSWNDIFWFTFFHEVGHLLMHSKKDAFINDVGTHSGVEHEADGFAAQSLIPRRFEADLAEVLTVQQAQVLADRIGIAPGVVVGRLQHDKRWPFNKGNELKQRFKFELS